MFFNSFTATEAEAHRDALIADATRYRLAKLARRARRGTRVAAAPSLDPDRAGPTAVNAVPECRYAVSR